MKWIVFDLNKPPKSGNYLISTETMVMSAFWNKRQKTWYLPGYDSETEELLTIKNEHVLAYCDLPEPYKP